MENPFSWPKELVEEWLGSLREVTLNRYPDPSGKDLKLSLREAMAVPEDMDILLGNGSDELIQLILMAVAGANTKVLAPAPTFSMYRMIATFVGMEFATVPLLNHDFSLDLPAMIEAVQVMQPAVIFIAYPNNPTGNLFAEHDLCALLEAAPGVVVLDEAYHAFADSSFLSYLKRYDNLLVLRTLSKMGLAGLRIGTLIGAPSWLAEFDKIRLPYNINTLSQVSARFALAHHDVLKQQTEIICAERTRLSERLGALNGVIVYPSCANFILFRVPEGRAQSIFDGLLNRGVLIKSMHGSATQLENCLRVTVGTPHENDSFMDALTAVL